MYSQVTFKSVMLTSFLCESSWRRINWTHSGNAPQSRAGVITGHRGQDFHPAGRHADCQADSFHAATEFDSLLALLFASFIDSLMFPLSRGQLRVY